MRSDSNLIFAVIFSGVLFFILGMLYVRNNPPEKKENLYQREEENHSSREEGITYEEYIKNGGRNPEELSRTFDSLKKVAAAELPVSCSFENLEDINFNKYVSITISNNTKKEINSVLLYITYSPFQNNLGSDTNFELKTRVTIRPGMSKTIKHATEYNINQIEVVKFSSNGKVEYNGSDAFLDDISRKL